MHLFMVRMPEMKAFWHLHPDQTQPGDFAVNLPIMPEGSTSFMPISFITPAFRKRKLRP